MKILFLCGSLEPGRDGVGDYTRRLAGELIRQGHNAAIIALKDKEVKNVVNIIQESGGSIVSVLRIPYKFSDKTRYTLAKDYLTQFDPEWVSWQFVIYSYQKKGLPFGLSQQIKKLKSGAERKWHIMFHEIWVGLEKEVPFRYNIYGILQKQIIKRILYVLNPIQIDTQSTLYQRLLEKLKMGTVNKLTLFGNIPIQSGLKETNKSNNHIIIIVFGSIYHGADFSGFTDWLCREGNRLNKTVEFKFIGKNGTELGKWINILEEKNISYNVYGQQSEDVISDSMFEATIGLGTTPYPLIEKSGSVAAMLEHNLPVICIARNWTSKFDSDIQIQTPVILWNNRLSLNEILTVPVKYCSDLKIITQRFIQRLSCY
jgi:hypothetical protein